MIIKLGTSRPQSENHNTGPMPFLMSLNLSLVYNFLCQSDMLDVASVWTCSYGPERKILSSRHPSESDVELLSTWQI